MISAQNIVKSFGTLKAVNGVSLEIRQGEFYSLLGPNGAGKSTTINILSSLIPADSGKCSIKGHSLPDATDQAKIILGVVPQEIALYGDLSATDNLMFWGGLYKVSKSDLAVRAKKLLADFGLSDRSNDKINTYSGGMKRRINIACAMMHDPEVLFMDEPTVGIDPQSRNNIYDTMVRLKGEGKTILYTTHYMEEAERFSDRIGIIDNGSIIAEGTLEELRTKGGVQESVGIECASVPENLSALNGMEYVRSENKLSFPVISVKSSLPQILQKCFEAGIDVTHVDVARANLESVFLALTGKKLRD